MRTFQSPEFADALKDAEPLTPIYGYQRTANQWRRYDKLPRLPDRFILMGDAVCAFNPVYGQGMTAAALGAVELDCLLADPPANGFGLRFQKRLAKALQAPWLMATGEDFRYPGTEGKRPGPLAHFVHWYIDRMLVLMPDSRALSDLFSEVLQMYKQPAALFQPWVFWTVLTSRPKAATTPTAKPIEQRQPIG
jgi:hypothetical protein